MRLSGTKTGSVNQYRGLGNQLWDLAGNLPTLDLRFAESKSLNDSVSGTNLITFTRPTGGSYVDSDGLLKIADINTPRFDHNPATGECLGLLVEEMSINELSRSEDFTDPIWPASSTATITTSTGIDDPKGTNTAATITNVSGSNLHRLISGTAGIPYTYSIWIRRRNGSGPIYLTVGDNILQEVTVTNTWTRVSATNTPTSTVVRAYVLIGSTGDSIDVWGAQLEEKAFATSYIGPTLGSGGLARMADTVSITGSNFSSWYNQSEGTLFADFLGFTVRDPNSFDRYIALVGSDPNADEISFFTQTAGISQGKIFGSIIKNNVTQASFSVSGGGPDFGGKVVLGYQTNNSSYTIDGLTVVTDTLCEIPTCTELRIFGQARFQLAPSGRISRLTYFPERLPDATLQAITL